MNKLIENMNEEELRHELKKCEDKLEEAQKRAARYQEKCFQRGVTLSQIRLNLQWPQSDKRTLDFIDYKLREAERDGLLSPALTA